MPALIASQTALSSLPPLNLTGSQVAQLLARAAAATSTDNAIVAVVDRSGNILGVRVEGNVSSAITSDTQIEDFSIDGAVSLARTAAFFSSNADPLTSRTVGFISQSTITQREVNSYTFISNPASTIGGPGFVAPVEIGGNFPPGVDDTPQVDLFGIENTNREMLVNAGPSGILNTPGDAALGANDGAFNPGDNVGLADTYNLPPAFVPAGQQLTSALSYYDTLLPAASQSNPNVPQVASRGIATLPGGIPIYEDGVLVGGIGVFFPGTTGFASAENSSLSAGYNPKLPDLSMEAEFIALAAVGGSQQAGFPIGTLNGVAALPGFDLPSPNISLAGITLNTVGPGGQSGPQNLVNYIHAHFSVGTGNPNSSIVNQTAAKPVNLTGSNDLPVDSTGDKLLTGKSPPTGWIVTPHAGAGITAAQVNQIIEQGISTADVTRSQLRPLGTQASQMVFAVSDSQGNILGLYRMPDAPIFSVDVAISKARDAAYYDDASQVAAVDQLGGIPAGTALTARTFRYLAEPFFPEGIDSAPPGPWSILNDPGTNPANGLENGPAQPISAFTSVFGYDAFHPNTTFASSGANTSGVVFFPGSSAVYVNGQIVGGFGVSGDGVNQDDFITAGGIAGYTPPLSIEADNFFYRGVRLPYQKFSRNPTG